MAHRKFRLSRPIRFVLIALWTILPVFAVYLIIDRVTETSRFITAVHARDIPEIKRFLNAGSNPNATKFHNDWTDFFRGDHDFGPYTPMETAALAGDTDIVKLMLDKGADVNHADEEGKTPLMWAVMKGPSDTTNLLFQRGADIRARDKEGHSPLYFAEICAGPVTVSLLLDHGAPVTGQGEDEDVLMYAVWRRSLPMAREALKRGADPNLQDRYGRTALKEAAFDKNTDIVALLKQYGAKE